MKKSNKGFTLVELIVVIAIIGILAAILVPALVGYIRDSKLSGANSSAKTVYTAINNYCQKCVTYEAPVANGSNYGGTVSWTGTEAALTYDGTNGDMGNAVLNSLNKDADGSTWAAHIDGGFPISVIWYKGDTTYTGRYPNAATATGEPLE